jgi:hypothetical protein
MELERSADDAFFLPCFDTKNTREAVRDFRRMSSHHELLELIEEVEWSSQRSLVMSHESSLHIKDS